jgi:hypothetical protein
MSIFRRNFEPRISPEVGYGTIVYIFVVCTGLNIIFFTPRKVVGNTTGSMCVHGTRLLLSLLPAVGAETARHAVCAALHTNQMALHDIASHEPASL